MVLFVVLISTVDKNPPVELHSDMTSDTELHELVYERSLNRRLGIRDLPMPPVPSDADDDVDDDDNDGLSEQALREKEDDLCDSIVKSYVKNMHGLTSPTEVYGQPEDEYVLMLISLHHWIKLSYVLVGI